MYVITEKKTASKPGLRTRSIFIRVQVRVQPILASPSSSSSSEIKFFRVQVRVRQKITEFFRVRVQVQV